jgi:hypothetical protein
MRTPDPAILDAELTQPMRLPTGTVSRPAASAKPSPVRPRIEPDDVTAVIDMTPRNRKEKGTDMAGSDER